MSSETRPTIALVGSPNSGKTTLFNWITGATARTVNYPGATVDYSYGMSLGTYGAQIEVIDTPGTYSLFPKTPEEKVTHELLFKNQLERSPSLLVVVVDATQFVRQIALARQLQQSGWPILVALTMTDIIQSDGGQIMIDILQQELEAPVVAIDGRLGGGVKDLLAQARTSLSQNAPPRKLHSIEWSAEDFRQHQSEWQEKQKRIVKTSEKNASAQRTQQLDRFLLHPFLGALLFLAIMVLLFSSIFWAAAPFMDWIDEGFSVLAEIVLNLSPEAMWADFLANGVIAGFGAFFVFVPQIFILFIGLNLLEDSGYLSRAATLVDKPLSWFGLNGRSFVPLLAGHACAVPAMMATRTIPNKRERWLTLAILPLMTCSARLPVYALLLSFLFTSALEAGIWLTIIYLASVLVGGLVSLITSQFLPKDPSSFFLLELPQYHRPKLTSVARSALEKTKAFVFRAGPVIFVLSLAIWGMTNFPAHSEADDHNKMVQSYAAQIGQFIEPVMKPMGLDWKAGIGIITSVAAREVFVSTMALIYNIADDSEEGLQSSLLSSMRNATFEDGSAVYTTGSIAGLIIFYMIALQCIATVSIARREANSWPFAIAQFIGFNLLAYALAVGANFIL